MTCLSKFVLCSCQNVLVRLRHVGCVREHGVAFVRLPVCELLSHCEAFGAGAFERPVFSGVP